MIAGADYVEVDHDKDKVLVTLREDNVMVTAHMTPSKAMELVTKLQNHIAAAVAYAPPSLIEYTSEANARDGHYEGHGI